MTKTPHEKLLADSGLFTQVEPDWRVELQGFSTWVNRSRGVVAVCRHGSGQSPADCHFSFDAGMNTYVSTGWYGTTETEQWIFPVLRSDRKWGFYCDLLRSGDSDITTCLDIAD